MTGLKTLSPKYGRMIKNIMTSVKPPNRHRVWMGQHPHAGFPDFSKLQEMLALHSPEHVVTISQQMRNIKYLGSTSYRAHWWNRSEPDPINKFGSRRYHNLELFLKFAPGAAPIFSVHSNGYVREKAVVKWPKINSAFELALLLIRMNDWVEPVRIAATQKLSDMLGQKESVSGLTDDKIIDCLSFILNHRRFGRMDEEQRLLIGRCFDRGNVSDDLTDKIISGKTDKAARLMRLALSFGLLKECLSDISERAEHHNVRTIAYRAMLIGKYVWRDYGRIQSLEVTGIPNIVEIGARALSDSSPAVQRVGLDFVIDQQPARLHRRETYERFMQDKRLSLVDRAEFGLRALGVDWKAGLRSRLDDGDLSFRDLNLLGRYGARSDADKLFIRAGLLPPDLKVRFFGAAVMIGHMPAKTKLVEMALHSPEVKIAKDASRYLRKVGARPEIHSIISAIEEGQDIIVRGFMAFIFKFPPIGIAMAIAALEQSELKYDKTGLLNALQKKRRLSPYLPSADKLDYLKRKTAKNPELRALLQEHLYVNLSS